MFGVRLRTLLALFATIVAICAVVFYSQIKSFWFEDSIVFSDGSIVQVRKGQRIAQVFAELPGAKIPGTEDRVDLLKMKFALRLFAKDALVKTGEYEIAGNYTRDRLLKLFASGKSRQHRLTLVDGFTTYQMIEAAIKSYEVSRGAVMDVQALQEDLANILDARAIEMMDGRKDLEGWFYPDTYFYARESAPAEPFQRAHRKLVDTLEAEWENRSKGLPIQSPYEALILASIIERESGHIDEREEIAGVFTRRLQKGMKLQTDPTVIYGMGSSYDGNIRRRDLQTDTPYNTYTRFGLPPTPIANPGFASIRAALHPKEGTALYFVARGDGSHVFSDTLEAHNRAVRQFQINNRRADYRSAPR